MTKMIVCEECGKEKPLYAKGLCNGCYKHKYYIKNREAQTEDRRRRRIVNHNGINEREQGHALRHRYGITREEYNKMLEAQGNKCAICGKTAKENGKRLSVDHNHETREVRGLLCQNCNMLLGLAQEDIEVLFNCIEYLRCESWN